MHTLTLAEQIAALQKGQFTASALAAHYLDRILRYDTVLRSFITLAADRSTADAARADARLLNGTASPLTGIPISYKDNFCTKGLPTTAGSCILKNFIPTDDATIVSILDAAGMVLLGKHNMDAFAMGCNGENSDFGVTKNPWDITRTAGGSSGGSAAAVAARLTPIATGSDTGGSVRQPAAYCGVTGLKPTYGELSRQGMIPLAPTLDHPGLIAQTAEDIANVFDGLQQSDLAVSALKTSLKKVTIGCLRCFQSAADSGTQRAFEAAIAVLVSAGAKIVDIDFPHALAAMPVYFALSTVECRELLLRYHSLCLGIEADRALSYRHLYRFMLSKGIGREAKKRLLAGTWLAQHPVYRKYHSEAEQLRRAICADFDSAFQQVDLLISPTTPTPAFPFQKNGDKAKINPSDQFTVPANLAGVPAITCPMGFVSGLPVGLQIFAQHFDTPRVLSAAHQYQLRTDFHRQVPTGF